MTTEQADVPVLRRRPTVRQAAATLAAVALAGAGWVAYDRLRTPSLEEEVRAAADAVRVYQFVYGGQRNGLYAGDLPDGPEDLARGGWTPHDRTILPEAPVQGRPEDWCLVLSRANSDTGSDVLRTGEAGTFYDTVYYFSRTGQVTYGLEPECTLFLTRP